MILRGVKMIFPLKKLVEYEGNSYEVTVAASRRAYQLAKVQDKILEENDGKVVSVAADQLFSKEIQYRIEKDN